MEIQLTDRQIFSAFTNLKRGSGKKGQGQVNLKPLLLLFILGRYWNNSNRMLLFRDMRYPFEDLLSEFANSDLHHEASMYPVWYMQSSKEIWALAGTETIEKWITSRNRGLASRRPSPTDAMYRPFFCGLTSYVFNRIINDKVMLLKLVFELLNKYFPVSKKQLGNHLHIRLLEAIGIPFIAKPDELQKKVYEVYRYSCSVCNYHEEGAEQYFNLQIAKIKTLRAPRSIINSIVFCDQHRSLFDFGAFTLAPDGKIIIAETYKREDNSKDMLSFEDNKAYFPHALSARPSEKYLAWHKAKVFNLQGVELRV